MLCLSLVVVRCQPLRRALGLKGKSMHSDDLFKDQAKTISSIVLAAETEDELGTVLRIHGVLEELLDVFLSSKTQGDVAKIVKIPRDFGAKLSLSTAFGLPLSQALVIHQFNVIRNKLAHAKSQSINKGDLIQLARLTESIASNDAEFTPIKSRYIEFPSKNPGQKLAFGEHGNRIDFVITFFVFYSFLEKWLKEHVEESA
ncbi:hypothetical protein O1D37_003623 [Vibrio cholerae]|nr:hypothetical protein [Vibrio cholerae]EKF9846906.1 hypothetical protein [Vibrio cholerae]HDI3250054.1 hypothetical protein [Vibrio cholerae]